MDVTAQKTPAVRVLRVLWPSGQDLAKDPPGTASDVVEQVLAGSNEVVRLVQKAVVRVVHEPLVASVPVAGEVHTLKHHRALVGSFAVVHTDQLTRIEEPVPAVFSVESPNCTFIHQTVKQGARSLAQQGVQKEQVHECPGQELKSSVRWDDLDRGCCRLAWGHLNLGTDNGHLDALHGES